jgi:hypothetical protein
MNTFDKSDDQTHEMVLSMMNTPSEMMNKSDKASEMMNIPNEMLMMVFTRVMAAPWRHQLLFVCRRWHSVLTRWIDETVSAIKDGGDAPRDDMLTAIRAYFSPSLLLAAFFPCLTMIQKVKLARTVTGELGRWYPLKSMFAVTWTDIMKYCRVAGDVDWLIDTRWNDHGNTYASIYKILFTDHAQFRKYINHQHPYLMTTQQLDARIRNHVYRSANNLFKNDWAGHDYSEIISDLEFIKQRNTVLPTLRENNIANDIGAYYAAQARARQPAVDYVQLFSV